MNRIVATMDDLPELPFEKVLSYLSLEDRLKARAVSRRWYSTINSFKVKTFCFSRLPRDFTWGKGRWISGAFAQNFIRSTRFSSFFNTFSPTILSNLKRLRICDLHLHAEDSGALLFVPTLNLFGQLEELDLIRFTHPNAASGLGGEIELNLPMLASIHLKLVKGIERLTLEAPKLKRVKLFDCSSSLRLELVHADSVEWLASSLSHVAAKNLKSLKYLHCRDKSEIDETFLSGLDQLKEVHLYSRDKVALLFEQKQRYGRTDLKIFLVGFLLNGPEDLAIIFFKGFNSMFINLSKNPSRLADEISLWDGLPYSAFDGVTPESAINISSRFTDLSMIVADSSIPAQDVQRFLDLLKNVPNIETIKFSSDQRQDLFDRLSEHSAVQYLRIDRPVSDFCFLFRLQHLIMLEYHDQITAEVVRKAFEELQFLQLLEFKHLDKQVQIVKYSTSCYTVSVDEKKTDVADLNAAIQLVFGRT